MQLLSENNAVTLAGLPALPQIADRPVQRPRVVGCGILHREHAAMPASTEWFAAQHPAAWQCFLSRDLPLLARASVDIVLHQQTGEGEFDFTTGIHFGLAS